MPYRFDIDEQTRRITTTVSGDLTQEEIRLGQQAMRDDPRFRSYYTRAVDIRELATVDFQLEQLVQIAYHFADGVESSNVRTAIVTEHSDFFDMARAFELITTRMGLDVCVFRDADAANDWLNATAA